MRMNRILDFAIPDQLRKLIEEAVQAGWQVKTERVEMTHRPGWSTIVWVKRGSLQVHGVGGMCGTGFADDLSDEALHRIFESLLRGAFYTDI